MLISVAVKHVCLLFSGLKIEKNNYNRKWLLINARRLKRSLTRLISWYKNKNRHRYTDPGSNHNPISKIKLMKTSEISSTREFSTGREVGLSGK